MAKRALVSLAALLGPGLLLGLASVGATQAPPPQAPSPEAPAPQAPTAQPGYVGTEACTACHEETAKSFTHTAHAGNAQGCEGCHGPGQAHMEDGGADKTKIRSFKTLSAIDASAICMECHNKGGQKHWMGSTHDSRTISCVTCHDPHPKGNVVPEALLSKPQMVLCTGCHLQKKAQLLRPGHMPMREGKMQCSSCHNAHGTPNDKMLLQTSVNQNCYTCHAEKRGPFLWEHPPVRENCLNCHDAHGTVHEKMLKVKAPLLCQQCHQTDSHPGPAYPAQSRYAFNQSCLHCHASIHGSVHPSGHRFFR
jgi:DmsE family decaheme c-type cytochrome